MPDEPRPVREGREKAEAVRYQHQLGDAPIRDLFGFIEGQFPELLVVRRPMLSGPDGALLKADKQWIIVVNTHDKMLARQRFTAAHELAHFLFDAESSIVRIDEDVLGVSAPVEMRVNAFAVHFLLPAGALRSRFMKRTLSVDDEESVVALAMEYGLSVRSLSWHMKNVLDLSESERKTIADIKNPYQVAGRIGLGYRVDQELQARDKLGWPREYLGLAMKALDKGRLTEGEFVEMIEDEEQARRLLETRGATE